MGRTLNGHGTDAAFLEERAFLWRNAAFLWRNAAFLRQGRVSGPPAGALGNV